MRNNLFYIIAISVLLSSACADGKRADSSESVKTDRKQNTQMAENDGKTIDMPEIPDSLREPSERADYLILHYWDKLDFTDTAKSHDEPLMEQSFVNFLSVFPYASDENIILKGFEEMLKRASSERDAYSIINKIAEDYLYNPNSPMLSEDNYLLYLKALYSSPNTTETERYRIEDRIDMVGKNRPGTKASDFTFLKPDGSSSTLYKTLPGPGKDLMLIFFDPDCENCEEILGELQADAKFMNQVESGTLRVLAIYEGENKQSWLKKASTFPSSWIIGINENEIDEQELYYLPAMPTIYLLDGNGIVKVKDMQLR